MKFYPENYRELSLDFLFEKRFLFGSESPKGKEAQSQNPDAKKDKKAPVIPFNGKDFQHHQERYEEHIRHLPKTVSAKKRQEFAQRLSQLQNDYRRELKNYQTDHHENPAKAAAQAVHPKVTHLMDAIRAHLPKDKIAQLNARFRSAPASRPAVSPSTAPATAPARKPAVPSKKPATQPVKKPGAAPKSNVDNAKKGPEITPEQYKQVTDKLCERFKIKDEGGRQAMAVVIKQLKLTPRQFQQITQHNILELNNDQKKFLKDNMPSTLEGVDKKELEHLKNFTKGSKLEKFFDNIEDPAFIILSQEFEIKAGKTGGITLAKHGKEIATIAKPEELLKKTKDGKGYLFFPKNIGDQFNLILQRKGKEADLNRLLLDKVNKNKAYMALRNGLFSKDSIEKAGPFGGLMMLLQLFKQIKKAFKTGNYDELNDYLQVWNKAKSPAVLNRMMKESKSSYETAVTKRQPAAPLSMLLKAYVNPRKTAANQLLTQTDNMVPNLPTSRFRLQLRPVIIKHLQNRTGLSDVQIKSANGVFQIIGGKAGKRYAIEVDLADPKQEKIQLVELTKAKDAKGKTITKPKTVTPFSNFKYNFNDPNTKLFDQLLSNKSKSAATTVNRPAPTPAATPTTAKRTSPTPAPVSPKGKVTQKK